MITVKEEKIEIVLGVHSHIPEFIATKPDKMYFEDRYRGKKKIILCAYQEEIPVGYLIAYDKYKDSSFYCWMAGVIPEYRNNGALTALMEHLFLYARENGYTKIKIRTRNNRRNMLRFLVKNGFDFTEVEKKENRQENRINLEKDVQ